MSKDVKPQYGDETELLDVDMEEFELLIDRSIDNLFVAADVEVKPAPSSGASDGHIQAAGKATVSPEGSPPRVEEAQITPSTYTASSPVEPDPAMDAIESQIDLEIDRLFVSGVSIPASDPQIGSSVTQAQTEKVVSAEHSATSYNTRATSEAAEEGKLHPADKPAAIGTSSGLGPDTPSAVRGETAEEHLERHMKEQLEAFSVAFLSLDWEFSQKNLTTLHSALEALETFCRREKGAEALLKIVKALVQHFQSRSANITPILVELLREAHELLKIYLISRGNVSAEERNRLNVLIGKLRNERQKEVSSKQVDQREQVMDPAHKEPDAPSPIPELQSNLPLQSRADLRESIELTRSTAVTLLRNFEEEKRKLDQIRAVLEKTPALAPVAARVEKICSGLAEQIAEYRKMNGNWSVLLNMAERLQKDQAAAEVRAQSETVEANNTATPSSSLVREQFRNEPEIRREPVCVFWSDGKRLAVPLSCLVKVSHLTRNKSNRILDRGFARLSDFRSFLGSIRFGVIGNWSGLPTGALKAFRFLPLSCDSFQTPPKSGTALAMLVSSGQSHGIIFSESEEVLFVHNAELVLEEDEGEILGVIHSESMGSVKVVHVGRLLERTLEFKSELATQ